MWRYLNRSVFLAGAAAAVLQVILLLPERGGAASLKGFMWMCAEGNQLCYWHKAVVTPPKGWIEDETWSRRYKAMVMFLDGDKSKSKPLMYVRAHVGDKELDLDKYVSVAQEDWKHEVPDSTIEPLSDFERRDKPTFKVYLYRNPSQPDQAFELTAFTKDIDVANPQNTFFFQIVLSSPDMAQIEAAKPAFYDLLERL
jgi:hypothetical protein